MRSTGTAPHACPNGREKWKLMCPTAAPPLATEAVIANLTGKELSSGSVITPSALTFTCVRVWFACVPTRATASAPCCDVWSFVHAPARRGAAPTFIAIAANGSSDTAVDDRGQDVRDEPSAGAEKPFSAVTAAF